MLSYNAVKRCIARSFLPALIRKVNARRPASVTLCQRQIEECTRAGQRVGAMREQVMEVVGYTARKAWRHVSIPAETVKRHGETYA